MKGERIGKEDTRRDMIEGNAGARKGMRNMRRDGIDVAEGGDGEGTAVARLLQGGEDAGDGVGVTPSWDMAVLYVPPYRRLRHGVRRRRLNVRRRITHHARGHRNFFFLLLLPHLQALCKSTKT